MLLDPTNMEKIIKESEKVIERRLCAEVKTIGGWALKLLSGLVTGLPDRMCLLPGGRIFFVEVKSTGCKPSKIQLVIHKRLEVLGFKVYVIDSTEKLNNFIKEL